MGTYNGFVASLTKGGDAGVTTLLSGVSSVTVVAAVPAKFFSAGQFAITASDGVSGTFGVEIYGGVGGATFLIAGRTNISAVGSFPIPFQSYLGDSSVITTTVAGDTGTGTGVGVAVMQSIGFPRPFLVDFVSGNSDVDSGFTASVYVCGNY